ncbi:fructose-6-phosphate aldolase [Clostridium sp. DL1XJH146]
MQYLLDTADLEKIKRAYEIFPMSGVTTNPTIVSKGEKGFLKMLRNIRKIIGNDSMLHVQVLGSNAEQMVKEAEYLNDCIGGNLYVKIPVTAEGVKAIKILKKKNIKITATAVITPQQALIAALAGAEYVAPYVNRIDNISGDGINVVSEIVQLFENYSLDSKVLAASFKNVQQVHSIALCGSHSATINPEIMDKLIEHPLTDWSIDQFISDWEKVYGEGTTTLDVE